MYGYGRGRGGGWWGRPAVDAPEGYRYVGPCRCGFGPHAYYQDDRGQLYHTGHVHRWGVPLRTEGDDIHAELESLKREKAALEKRLRDLEARLSEEPE